MHQQMGILCSCGSSDTAAQEKINRPRGRRVNVGIGRVKCIGFGILCNSFVSTRYTLILVLNGFKIILEGQRRMLWMGFRLLDLFGGHITQGYTDEIEWREDFSGGSGWGTLANGCARGCVARLCGGSGRWLRRQVCCVVQLSTR